MKENEYLKFWQKNPFRNLWQHPLWARFQESIGRKTWIFQTEHTSALVIKHALPMGFSWLEIPRGPLFGHGKSADKLLEEVVTLARQEGVIFVRMSPYHELEIGNWKLEIAKHDHHPQTSLILDLSLSEEELLKRMKSKGRYNIKVAQKHGVKIKTGGNLDAFYNLLRKTTARDGFSAHPKSYYEKMMRALEGHAQLLLAEHQGKIIAGGIFVYLDEWGIYYYGASSDEHRNLMAPYLVQWEAIREAKKRGCRHYDFLGIAPEHAQKHPWKGVTEFKKKFGGEVVTYPSAQELVMRPVWYRLYRFYKKIVS